MSVVVVHRDGRPIGAIGIRDELRPEVPVVVAALALAAADVGIAMGATTPRRCRRPEGCFASHRYIRRFRLICRY